MLAEWRWEGAPSLHVHCHVSGQERWLAPPQLRNYIFKREMALVRCLTFPAVHLVTVTSCTLPWAP